MSKKKKNTEKNPKNPVQEKKVINIFIFRIIINKGINSSVMNLWINLEQTPFETIFILREKGCKIKFWLVKVENLQLKISQEVRTSAATINLRKGN